MARESKSDLRAACILPADCKYVGVDARDRRAPVYRLKAYHTPDIEGPGGPIERFYEGESLAEIADDYNTTTRAIEAAIRTVRRFVRGMRS